MTNQKQSNWLALIGISIAGFLGCLDLTIVNTALPAIQNDFNISISTLQWVMTILLLALTTFMVISGKLADLYGRRLCFYIGMILFAVSSLGAGLSPTIQYLIFFRFLQGISIAFLYTAPVAIIPSLFPEQDRGKATGFLIGANGLGLASGPVIGGFIVSALGWRWIFLINLPLIILSLGFCWNQLTESRNENAIRKIDWWGFVFLIIALPSLILSLVQGSLWGWTSLPIISLLVISLLSFLVFYFVEIHGKAPIIEFHLFANRIFLIGLCANFSLAMFYAIDFFLIPLFLHFIQGQVGYQIGLTLLPATFMVSILSAVTGRIVDARGPKHILMLGLLLFILSAFLQAGFNSSTSLYFILFAYFLFGIGWACILSPSIVAALSSVPKESAGVGMGTVGTLHNLGGSLGLAIGTLIYNVFSKGELISQLRKNNIFDISWIHQAINNIDEAKQIIYQNTHLSLDKTFTIFQDYFLTGYRSAMWFLVIVTFIAFLIVTFGLKNKKVDSSLVTPMH